MTLMPRPHPLRYGQFDTLQDMLRGPLNQVCVCVGGGGGAFGWEMWLCVAVCGGVVVH